MGRVSHLSYRFNDEIRMTNDETNSNGENRIPEVTCSVALVSYFELRPSFDIRHSCFVILR